VEEQIDLSVGQYDVKILNAGNEVTLEEGVVSVSRNGQVTAKLMPVKVAGESSPTQQARYALRFMEPEDRVDLGTDLELVNKYTIEGWLYPMSGRGGSLVRLAGKGESQQLSWLTAEPVLGAFRGNWENETFDGLVIRDIEIGQRTHFALSWNGNTYEYWINGKKGKEAGYSRDKGDFLKSTISSIGAVEDTKGCIDGLIETLRYSQGVRYKFNFTPPNRFEADENTIALYHMDEGRGGKLTDSSGNGHHGNIYGAEWIELDPETFEPREPTLRSTQEELPKHALRFMDEDTAVVNDTFQEPEGPYTVDVWFTRRGTSDWNVLNALYNSKVSSLHISLGPRKLGDGWRHNILYAIHKDKQGELDIPCPDPIPLDKPTHVSVSWTGKEVLFFVNGVRIDNKVRRKETSQYNQRGMKLGGYGANRPYKQNFVGDIEEYRVSRGVRHTENFVPPRHYEPDDDTLLLYNFDDGNGNVLRDRSGKGHHGMIVNARWVDANPQTSEPMGNAGEISLQSALSLVEEETFFEVPDIEIPFSGSTVEGWIHLDDFEQVIGFPQSIFHVSNDDHRLILRLAYKPNLFHKYWTQISCVTEEGLVEYTRTIPRVTRDLHYAVCHSLGKPTLFLNGREIKLNPSKESEDAKPSINNRHLTLGSRDSVTRGSISTVRVSDTIRYTDTFLPERRFEKDQNTIALYHFEEGQGQFLKDSSGNNNHATIYNPEWVELDTQSFEPIRFSAQSESEMRYALNFEGAENDLITIPTLRELGDKFTIEGWITPKPLEDNKQTFLIRVREQDQDTYIHIANFGQYSLKARHVKAGGATAIDESIHPSQRIHFAAVWGQGAWSLYIDGKWIKTIPSKSKATSQGARGTWIGALSKNAEDGASISYSGLVEAVRFSRGNPYQFKGEFTPPNRFEADENTVALYNMDEGSGDLLVDSSGNGHNGTIEGAEWVELDPQTFEQKEISSSAKPLEAPSLAVAPFSPEEARQHQEAWAKHLGIPVEYTNSIGMKFRLIPPGEFLMGSTVEEINALPKSAIKQWREYFDAQTPQHKVILTQPIYMSVTEVTQSEYETVMGENPSHFSPSGEGQAVVANLETSSHPVEMVSWNDAAEFCAKLSQREGLKPNYFRAQDTVTLLDGSGYRLPSEAEWEFSCRAGTTTQFWIGDQDEDLLRSDWIKANSGDRTHSGGELAANPLGLYDMHGNVWEWVQDAWDATSYKQYAGMSAIDPVVESSVDAKRIGRGGYWSNPAYPCRSANRYAHAASDRSNAIGFRVVVPVDPVKILSPASRSEP